MNPKQIAAITHTFPFGTMQDSFFDDEIKMLAESNDLIFFPTASAKSRESSERFRLYKDAVRVSSWGDGVSWLKLKWIFFSFKTVLVDFLKYELRTAHKGTLRSLLVVIAWAIRTPDRVLSANILSVYSFWGTNIGYYGKLLARFKRVSSVVRFHRYDLYEQSGKAVPFNRSLFVDDGVSCLFLGKGAAEYAASVSRLTKAEVVPLFVRNAPFTDVQECTGNKSLRVVSISSDEKKKRLDKIHDVLLSLQTQHDHTVVWRHYGQLKNSQYLFDSEFVSPVNRHYMGLLTQEELRKVLNAGDVDFVIFMSDSEGIPYSMLQAMSFGVPVFSTNVGEISSVKVQAYEWLVDIDLDADSAAHKINSQLPLIKSESVRRHIQTICRSHFGRSQTLNKIEKLLQLEP